jgi:1,4-dihydroxy-6-naphthoate synthase
LPYYSKALLPAVASGPHTGSVTTLRLAFSPDSDDIFMFWALLTGRIDARGYTFTAERADTEQLNAWALEGKHDVIAVSMGHYARISANYMLLPHGASVGRGYGPMVIAKDPHDLAWLRGKRVAIPGERTTAYSVLRVLEPVFEAITVPIAPYERVFEALRSEQVDAALVIHEGRLTYAREGFRKVADLGEEWHRVTGLPLPLGGNAISRALGAERIAEVSELCRASIRYALEHREEAMTDLLAQEHRTGVGLTHEMLSTYLDMYANADTLNLPEDGREAVRVLAAKMRNAGLLTEDPRIDFAV